MIILNSLIVTKNVEGGFGLFQHPFSCKISKKLKRGPFGDKTKFRKKILIAPKKIERGDPLVSFSSGFVGYVKKVKNEKGRSFGDKKIFEKKVAQCRKKSKGGTLSVPSGFLGYLEKVKKKGGNL